MADSQAVVGQKLNYGAEGTLEVVRTFTADVGLLHMTVDGGFYFGPGKPLTDDEIANKLPEPYHELAHTFIANLPPPEPPPPEEEGA